LEDYLEAIYRLVEERGEARAKDVGEALGVRGSSVTGALRSLAERRLINYHPYRSITLTPAGTTAGRRLLRRHEALRSFLRDVLRLEPAEAEAAACGMEHAVSERVLARLLDFIAVAKDSSDLETWRPAGEQEQPEAGEASGDAEPGR
jgi:DtxR family Mn-dependent transcriptional regulator